VRDKKGRIYYYVVLTTQVSRDEIWTEKEKAVTERNIRRKNLFYLRVGNTYKLIRVLYRKEIINSIHSLKGKQAWEKEALSSTQYVKEWLQQNTGRKHNAQ